MQISEYIFQNNLETKSNLKKKQSNTKVFDASWWIIFWDFLSVMFSAITPSTKQ